jgi:hypothetical protein
MVIKALQYISVHQDSTSQCISLFEFLAASAQVNPDIGTASTSDELSTVLIAKYLLSTVKCGVVVTAEHIFCCYMTLCQLVILPNSSHSYYYSLCR